MSFVHLHVHTEYSLLDGFSNINKLVQHAKELEMPALAITDHGAMYGVIEFYNAAVKAGIKPIIGVEAYMAARGMQDKDSKFDKKSSHVLLIAENETGYQNLLKISSAAQLEGFYYFPRIDHDFLASHSEGLICTSGCMAAEIPRHINNGEIEAAKKKLDWYYDVFGSDNFFLELQKHDIPELEVLNKSLLDMGKRYKSNYVATNDVHYIKSEHAQLQDVLLAVQTGSLLTDPNRMRMSGATYYLKSPHEMASIFAEVPGAISNTLLIAERTNLDLGFKGYHLPNFPPPEGQTGESYLRSLCEKGLEKKYGEDSKNSTYVERLNYELDTIHKMGFDAYFLIVWDLCKYARSEGIWYNARGSAAGSIVAYSLGITLVDPIEHGLIFERFLNPGRVSMPDIDLDFRDDRRSEMMEYCARKYGSDKVAQIITFGKMKARAAIRDVGRVQDIPLPDVDRVAKLIPNIPGKPVNLEHALENINEFKDLYNSTPYLRGLIETAIGMEGVIRNAGTHAAGVIITDKPAIEYVPLHRPTGSAQDSPIKTVTQFEMSVVDALGLLKVDFLGLATLTIMARACDLIKERHNIKFSLDNIPTNEPKTYELLGRGDTAGVFQVEGSGMRRNLMAMKPKNLDHVIAMVALFRPGPMEFIPSYIRRMHGEEQVEYRHPSLEPILKETYGITVYQEQIMYSAMELAGYTASEADFLRKAVAKKKEDALLKQRSRFVSGAVKNQIPVETANLIFDDWEAFARYGFPKGHAADYGVIAVQTAYLKTHYPVEYMTALLSVSQSDSKKVAFYVADCKRMGIDVLSPDVTSSGWDFTIEENSEENKHCIRFGLGAVKNVGPGPVDVIIQAREDKTFEDLNDFIRRVDLRKVGKRVLECLIKVGALNKFGKRVSLLGYIDQLVSLSASHFKASDVGQMSFFDSKVGVVEEIALPQSDIEINKREMLIWERELIGLYVSDHPLNPYRKSITQKVSHYSTDLIGMPENQNVTVAGMITNIRAHQTKKGAAMGFVTIEDLQGTIDLVLFPSVWKNFGDYIIHDNIVLVKGRTDSNSSEPKVLVNSLSTKLKQSPWMEEDQSPEIDLQNIPGAAEKTVKPSSQPANRTPSAADELDHKESKTIYPDNNNWNDDDLPPPPETFPSSWEIDGLMPEPVNRSIPGQDSESEEKEAQSPEKKSKSADMKTGNDEGITPQTIGSPSEVILPDSQDISVDHELAENLLQSQASLDLPSAVHTYIIPPIPAKETKDIRMLTVVLRNSMDSVRDKLRVRQVFGIIISYPGPDRFAFHIFENGHGHLLEFPNLTTEISPELISRIGTLVGSNNLRVEPITFQ